MPPTLKKLHNKNKFSTPTSIPTFGILSNNDQASILKKNHKPLDCLVQLTLHIFLCEPHKNIVRNMWGILMFAVPYLLLGDKGYLRWTRLCLTAASNSPTLLLFSQHRSCQLCVKVHQETLTRYRKVAEYVLVIWGLQQLQPQNTSAFHTSLLNQYLTQCNLNCWLYSSSL